ncbi:hypothetical protein AA103196_1486 [Ameyamaea chiangmaiensis NBRC 103196]|uniref:Enamine deaminase RidA, house cleaning of reactive enamine intermediates, YjgF/YER057c/UK114 family n=1 Tax=Ameyamaea chiangmaiensis TaxID=442969 RepID=A0A850PFI2_9PROT|nr:hypothetical protein [Ameyamaea chiangmaiensis]MBS4075307.1 hypothetical protein [Ameyamaea chiangmaiensis]NVN41593.1 hypothetical protein [Ameyamaea chiangmaiensis]GBQ66710.1 hypothetical protein AA103196_1486 [Ameyamaea chiangmaiensis NBRC 103196]
MNPASPPSPDGPAAARVVLHRGEVRILGLTGMTVPADPAMPPPGIVEQCRRALVAGADMMGDRGLSLYDVIRVTCLVQDCDAFAGCFGLLRDAFGPAAPVFTLRTVAGFETAGMSLELELTARGR